MGQHDAPNAFAVNISVNQAAVFGRKRNRLLSRSSAREQQHHNQGNQGTHAANVSLRYEKRLLVFAAGLSPRQIQQDYIRALLLSLEDNVTAVG
jgi:hypothetical protein